MEKVGSGIQNGKKSDPGSVINIPDPQHCRPDKQTHAHEMLWFSVPQENGRVLVEEGGDPVGGGAARLLPAQQELNKPLYHPVE
jgi:hypothetical protein